MNLTDRQLERLRILACPDSYVSSLCDTDRAAVRAAVEELERLKAAVQAHHDQKGDDRCHLDDLKLYHDILGEGTDPFAGALPPDDDMLESCRRYLRQRRCPGPEGVLPLPDGMTIAQLTAEVARLRAALASIREKAGRNAPPSRPVMAGLETILRAIEADARAALIGGDR